MKKIKLEKDYQDALGLVNLYFKNIKKAEVWMAIPNPMIGNMSPSLMIDLGRKDKLMNMIQSALDENKRDN